MGKHGWGRFPPPHILRIFGISCFIATFSPDSPVGGTGRQIASGKYRKPYVGRGQRPGDRGQQDRSLSTCPETDVRQENCALRLREQPTYQIDTQKKKIMLVGCHRDGSYFTRDHLCYVSYCRRVTYYFIGKRNASEDDKKFEGETCRVGIRTSCPSSASALPRALVGTDPRFWKRGQNLNRQDP